MDDQASDGETLDALLDGRVRLWQPREGYRAATDPVFLAAAIEAAPGQWVLDLGTGVGAAALCLAARVPGALLVGIEIAGDMARLATANGRQNRLTFQVVTGDARALPFAAGVFDHVMANPPYLVRANATPSPSPSKARANLADAPGELTLWVREGFRVLRPGGSLTLIHRADRLDAVLATIEGITCGITIFPLWPRAGAPAANRVIVRAIKASRAPLRLAAGLIVHGEGNAFSEPALAVLRAGQALDL
jgi:tRNA1(Val) A37 N6-methylase TrmN6